MHILSLSTPSHSHIHIESESIISYLFVPSTKSSANSDSVAVGRACVRCSIVLIIVVGRKDSNANFGTSATFGGSLYRRINLDGILLGVVLPKETFSILEIPVGDDGNERARGWR